MGADIYIRSISDKPRAQYKPLFEAAVAARNSATDLAEKARFQAEVDDYYNRMHEHDPEAYFGDSYDSSNLLTQLDLSWWSDIVPILDEEGTLPPGAVQWLRTQVTQRGEILEHKIATRVPPFSGPDAIATADYFRAKLQTFIAFLNRAIGLNEGLYCSL